MAFVFVHICSSYILLLVPREGCASWLWHFLGIFTYIFVNVFGALPESSVVAFDANVNTFMLHRQNTSFFSRSYIVSNDLYLVEKSVKKTENTGKIYFLFLFIYLSVLLAFSNSGYRYGLCNNVSSSIRGHRMSRSACSSVQCDQGLYCSLSKSMITTECMN